MPLEEYKFPDEINEKASEKDDDFEIEIEDDTPEQDRGKKPSDPKFVEELDNDELDEYSASAKQKIAAFKKVYHDERRAKEAADREREEAVALAQRLYDENKKLKGRVAKMTLTSARQAEENFKNKPVQEEKFVVQTTQPQKKVYDPKAENWRERNSWFGSEKEMTALAYGLHEKLVEENGPAYASTDEYYRRIDATMRKRFPEKFEEEMEVEIDSKPSARPKPSNVVAPATRSTSSKKSTSLVSWD